MAHVFLFSKIKVLALRSKNTVGSRTKEKLRKLLLVGDLKGFLVVEVSYTLRNSFLSLFLTRCVLLHLALLALPAHRVPQSLLGLAGVSIMSMSVHHVPLPPPAPMPVPGPMHLVPRTPMMNARRYRSLFPRRRVAPSTPPSPPTPPPSDGEPSNYEGDVDADEIGDPKEPYAVSIPA
ncbi:hypothetical protein PIB30_045656 [Stylosanthes scabra]|uniref:Uncharacterized protein n=1 Tax=Stylosanthes scabra TaxID=79078 RepID=A0ABU6ZEZ0_9FABA|nr:hypothetical protein [Stylosanthes scabra]